MSFTKRTSTPKGDFSEEDFPPLPAVETSNKLRSPSVKRKPYNTWATKVRKGLNEDFQINRENEITLHFAEDISRSEIVEIVTSNGLQKSQIRAIVQRPNGLVDITCENIENARKIGETIESANFVYAKVIKIHGDNETTIIIRDVPYNFPSERITNYLTTNHATVLKRPIRRLDEDGIDTGRRDFIVKTKELQQNPIPSYLHFGKYQLRVTYRGQRSTCAHCAEYGHKRKECPRRKRKTDTEMIATENEKETEQTTEALPNDETNNKETNTQKTVDNMATKRTHDELQSSKSSEENQDSKQAKLDAETRKPKDRPQSSKSQNDPKQIKPVSKKPPQPSNKNQEKRKLVTSQAEMPEIHLPLRGMWERMIGSPESKKRAAITKQTACTNCKDLNKIQSLRHTCICGNIFVKCKCNKALLTISSTTSLNCEECQISLRACDQCKTMGRVTAPDGLPYLCKACITEFKKRKRDMPLIPEYQVYTKDDYPVFNNLPWDNPIEVDSSDTESVKTAMKQRMNMCCVIYKRELAPRDIKMFRCLCKNLYIRCTCPQYNLFVGEDEICPKCATTVSICPKCENKYTLNDQEEPPLCEECEIDALKSITIH